MGWKITGPFAVSIVVAVGWAGSVWIRSWLGAPIEPVVEMIGLATAVGMIVAKRRPGDEDD